MAYPITPETLDINIQPTDKVSVKNHANQHNDVNRLVMALMQKVGIDYDTNPSSLDYMIRHIAGIGVTQVSVIFDDPTHSLPLDTSIQIDGYTITDGDIVYVKDSLTPTEINNIYVASVSGTTITWTLDHTRAPNEIVYALHGVTYGNTFFFGGSIFIQNDITALNAFFTDLITNNLTVTNLTISGGGQVIVNGSWKTEFWTADGTSNTFVLSDTPVDENSVLISTDSGTWQLQSITKDYTVDLATKTITFTYIPNIGEEFQFKYMVGADAGTVPGGMAYIDEFVATAGQTEFTLTNTPAGSAWIWVSTESSLYGKQGLTRDYTYDSGTNTITFNYPLQAGDVVSVQYIGFVAAPATEPTKKVTGVVWTGPSNQLIVNDTDCTEDSVILGWTIKSGTQAGFWQFTVGNGSFTIDSTATESGLTFNYVIYK